MTATKTQLLGGAFQDSEGNLLVNGYLEFVLNQDSSVTGVGSICSGITIRITLDSVGNVASSASTPSAPNQFIWATDVLLPVNAYYTVTGFTSDGQPSWGPNNQQVTSGGTGGGTFDLGTWVPNQVFSWTPPLQPLELETNGVANTDQTLLNQIAGTNITLTADSNGGVTFDVPDAPVLPVFQTNGVDNNDQAVENLIAGTNVTLTADGSGGTTIAASGVSFSTSGHGWLLPDTGIAGATSSSTGQYTPANTDNEVLVYQIIIPSTYTFRKISTVPNSAGGSGNASCAIYSFDGLTKYIDAGANAFAGSPGGAVVTVSVSPVTLSPGVYWLACSSTNHLMVSAVGFSLSSGAAGYFSLVNGSQTRTGKAANAMSAGAMPATLGAISTISDPASGFARFLFEC